MTTAPALLPCPFCGGDAELSHVLASVGRNYFAVECADKRGCRVVVSSRAATEAEAIAAWNARPGGDEAVRTAEDRGYKRAVKMVAALIADAMVYSDSYGVQGSDFLCCMACNAGGAPGVPFEHSEDCIVLKCETIADDFWQEQRDELNALNEENEQLRAALRTQGERRGAKQDIVDLAKDLVALWTSPKISGLPRSERNAAIEDTRNAMIEAVGNLARSSVGSEQGSSNSEVTGSSPVAPATNAAVAQSAERPFCKGTVSGSSPDGGTNTQPAPIAGLEPVASLLDELREYTALRYAGDCKCGNCQLVPRATLDRAIQTMAQLEAHAAEQVRAEREAWQLKLQQLYESASRKLRDTSCLMSNPPQNSAVWDIRNEIAALHARAQMERGE